MSLYPDGIKGLKQSGCVITYLGALCGGDIWACLVTTVLQTLRD